MTLEVSGDEHGHVTAAALQHLDHLIAGESAGGGGANTQDVITCAETPILIGGEES